MDQVKFVEDSLSDRIRPYHFKLFKGYLPQILLGSFLNNLTHIMIMIYLVKILLQISLVRIYTSSFFQHYDGQKPDPM